MKNYRKLFTILSLVLLLSTSLAGVASADVVKGIGWIAASGSGVANIHMTGRIEIEASDQTLVYIFGAESIEARGHGERADLPGGGVVFRGYEGTIKAAGEQMRIRIAGQQVKFKAHGRGIIHLRGRGHYETRGHSGNWSADGTTVEVAEE